MTDSKRPNRATFIGIGAQKTASTWLYGVLQQCPDVVLSDDKEIDFFSYFFDRGYEWYERFFTKDRPSIHRGEISPSYFIHPAAAERAFEYNPDLQILVTLRDPIARAYSNHLHEVRKGHISGENLIFETALKNNPLYLDQSMYTAHLKRWFDVFPKNQIHVYFQEEIFADRQTQAELVIDALKLPKITDFLDLKANESVQYKNAAIGTALWNVGNFARKNGMGRAIEIIKSAPGIRGLRNSNRVDLRTTTKPMTSDTEARLIEIFSDDVSELETLLERSPPWKHFTKIAKDRV